MDKRLHIVSFDVPFPANYGGVIDVFYKIKSLHAQGIKIVLHCFLYGERSQAPELSLYCERVHYYRRTVGVQGFSLLRPYIVNSRKNASLLKNLLVDESPILFEGLHSCYYLNHPQLADRRKYVRAHNIEHEYYTALAKAEKKWWKRFYYRTEAQLLKQYEEIYFNADKIFTISGEDYAYFFEEYWNAEYLPAFHANKTIESKEGRGDYCLFHGNLEVGENEEAVLFLINDVFSKLNYPIKIAGANPSDYLISKISEFDHLELVANPSNNEMDSLLSEAQVHVLYTAERSGLKLKLLASLFKGRYVIANDSLIEIGTLKDVCIVANSAEDYIQSIEGIWEENFTDADIQLRKEHLLIEFSNTENAKKIIDVIFS